VERVRTAYFVRGSFTSFTDQANTRPTAGVFNFKSGSAGG